MSVKISLAFTGHVVQEGDSLASVVMFSSETYDEVDEVLVIVTASMSMRKWMALGRPTITEVEIGE